MGDLSDEKVLELKGIGKTFSGVNVLRDIGFDLYRGEVHALLGENGAGKSTFIKILAGYHQSDKGGVIKLDGKEVVFKKPIDAIRASIHTIYQELTLCPDMTVAENIVLDKQHQFKGVNQNRKEFQRIATDALSRLGAADIKPEMMVRKLSLAQRQIVEIGKAISSEAKVILMDEPTSSISHQDAEVLLGIVRNLRDEGISIIYISHRLHEIKAIADRVTVLRDGLLVDTVDVASITNQDLVSMMVGRSITNAYPKEDVDLGEVILKLENISVDGLYRNVSFEVRRGEIFGIGGLVGARRTEVLETIFGLHKMTSGKMYVKGEKYIPKNPRTAIANKIAMVTEDRKKSGLVLCLPVFENLSLINAQRKSTLGTVNWKKLKKMSADMRDMLSIRLNRLDQLISTLSGGNQQKVALGKWLDFAPDILLIDEPTRGVDIGAKTEIYTILGNLAKAGVAIVMVSSELSELISVTDNIMVMREGEVKGIVRHKDATQESVMALATQN